MQQNNARIGGILSIVSGSLGILSALSFIAFGVLMGFIMNSDVRYDGYYEMNGVFNMMMVVYVVGGIIGIIVSALAVIGGIFALRKKNWGLALAGSIGGVLAFFHCGVVAVIFTAMSKPEFDAAPATPAV
jgi:hypothetical protein